MGGPSWCGVGVTHGQELLLRLLAVHGFTLRGEQNFPQLLGTKWPNEH